MRLKEGRIMDNYVYGLFVVRVEAAAMGVDLLRSFGF
jgi:hypothetical protein